MSQNKSGKVLFSFLVLLALFSEQVLAGTQNNEPVKQLKSSPQVKKKSPDLRKRLLSNPAMIPGLLKKGSLSTSEVPNPHWISDGCIACHKTNKSAGRHNIRHRDIDKLCNFCHTGISSDKFIHPSDISVPREMLAKMTRTFRNDVRQNAGKLRCTTCHELPISCLNKPSKAKGLDSMFLRDGPYDLRTTICFHCHDEKKYQRINAHDQISKAGKLDKEKCSLCHADVTLLENAKSINDVDFNVKENLSAMCWGCHPWKPHPGGPFTFFSGKGGKANHLVKPSDSLHERIIEMEKKNGIILPLEPKTGKLFCGTCHNPHEKGVIKSGPAAKGADEDKRLRMQSICSNCHDKF